MPRPRFTRAPAELRAAILDVAGEEFAAHGYAGASLNRILLAAGLSKGAFYYYFDDKADLAATVLERELVPFDVASLPTVKTAKAFWAEVSRFAEHSLQQLKRSARSSELLTRLGSAVLTDPELMKRCGPLFAEAQAQGTKLWQRGQAVGAVREDLPIPTMLALVQACKTTLATQLLPADRGATHEELVAFTKIYLELVKRMAEP